MSQKTVRIRLIHPTDDESSLVGLIMHPALQIGVDERDGTSWVVPSLAEGIAHLLSADGFRLYIRSVQYRQQGDDAEHLERVRDDGYLLEIERDGDDLTVDLTLSDICTAKQEWVAAAYHDLTIDTPLRPLPQLQVSTRDVSIDT